MTLQNQRRFHFLNLWDTRDEEGEGKGAEEGEGSGREQQSASVGLLRCPNGHSGHSGKCV